MPTTSRWVALRPGLSILAGASVVLSLALGLRQSMGLFMPALTRDTGLSVADFTLAIAVQNLVWGLTQPLAGAWVPRIGYRRLMVAGSALYVVGLVVLATAQGWWGVMLGAGVAIGAAMSCCGSAMTMAAAARPVSAAMRSSVLGIVSAVGSLGAMVAAPLGQLQLQAQGWRAGIWGFALLALVMLPAAWAAGRSDHVPLPAAGAAERELDPWRALAVALRQPLFVVMSVAYFVCGMQLIFLTTHLPAYLQLCGMDPMLGAQALGVIGGFNVLGSLFFGWAGGRWSKLVLLGLIYVLRSITLAGYFVAPPTPGTTLLFAAVMGFLWLGVSPLVAGWIADTFGLRWQAMLGGVAFFCHQIGSFVGAFGGGLIFTAAGSYELAWRIGVAVGLAAGLTQIALAWPRRLGPPLSPA